MTHHSMDTPSCSLHTASCSRLHACRLCTMYNVLLVVLLFFLLLFFLLPLSPSSLLLLVLPSSSSWVPHRTQAIVSNSSRELHSTSFCAGVGDLVMDVLSQLQRNGGNVAATHGAHSVVVLGPPGTGTPLLKLPICFVSCHYSKATSNDHC